MPKIEGEVTIGRRVEVQARGPVQVGGRFGATHRRRAHRVHGYDRLRPLASTTRLSRSKSSHLRGNSPGTADLGEP